MLWYAAGLAAVIALVILADVNPIARYGVLIIAAAVTFLVLNFFRDPERTAPTGERLVMSWRIRP